MPRKASILVVDDDESFLEFCCSYLTHLGHDVLQAESGNKALEILENVFFDVVVTDHVTVGPEAKPILKLVQEKQPGTRVIMMSGIPTLDEAKRSYLSGAQSYLAKPFSIDELREAVDFCMEPPSV
jgi:DNA-binding NtrC family response regulator